MASSYLNALGLPSHLDEKAELEDKLGGITSRLKKVRDSAFGLGFFLQRLKIMSRPN